MTREEEIAELQRKIEALKLYRRLRERVIEMGLDPDVGPDLTVRDPALPLAPAVSPQGSGWQEPKPLRSPLDEFAGKMVDADLARRK